METKIFTKKQSMLRSACNALPF